MISFQYNFASVMKQTTENHAMTIAQKIAQYGIANLQNHPANINQDHMTICAFFRDDAQWVAHRDKLQVAADNYDAS